MEGEREKVGNWKKKSWFLLSVLSFLKKLFVGDMADPKCNLLLNRKLPHEMQGDFKNKKGTVRIQVTFSAIIYISLTHVFFLILAWTAMYCSCQNNMQF